MNITKTQLKNLITKALNEVSYYTKKTALTSEEAAKKLETKFDDHSNSDWSGSYDKDEDAVLMKSKLEFNVVVKIREPKDGMYDIATFINDDEKPANVKKIVTKDELEEFVKNIDNLLVKMLSSKVRG